MNIVVFDIETTELAPKGVLEERDLCVLDISVAAAFDYKTGEYSIYMKDNIHLLWHRMVGADLITGFNITGFDLPIMHCVMEDRIVSGGGNDPELKALNLDYEKIKAKTYDLYFEAKAGAGAGKFDRGYNCDGILRSTWGAHMAKTGNGKEAPQLWKDGKLGELASYCMADVHRERLIFERCWTAGRLRSLGYKEGKEDFQVEHPQVRLDIEAALPHRLEGDLDAPAEPGAAYVAPDPVAKASDDI